MHLKRITMPRSWPLPKKEKVFITSGKGSHKNKLSIPIVIILRDILNFAKTKNEIKKILQQGLVSIDNYIIKDEKFKVGIFDRIYIKKIDKAFTIILTKKGKLKIIEINKDDANKKYCKVIGKKILKGNKTQINLYDGKNFITEKKDIKVGDSIILDLKTKKIIGHLKLENGAFVFIIGGKHIGNYGKIAETNDKLSKTAKIVTVNINKKESNAKRKNIFVINKEEKR